MVARHPAGGHCGRINESRITRAADPAGRKARIATSIFGAASLARRWRRVLGAASVSDADTSTFLPDDRDGSLGAAMEEDEALGNGGGAGNFQAGSSGRQVEDVAVNDRGLGIGNDLGNPRHQAGRADAHKSAVFAHLGYLPEDTAPTRIFDR